MGNRVLAIEVGQKLTRICEVDYKKSDLRMYRGITFDTPVGAVEDGHVREKVGLSKLFREQLSAAKISTNKVVFTISSNRIASREVVVPYLKKQQVYQLVQSNASDYFPVKIDEYSIAFNILEVIEEKEKKLRLLVLAIPLDLIQSYYELAELSGLNVLSIDYAGNSSYQAFKKNDSIEVNMIVHLNDNNGYISILDKDRMLLQRTIPYGSSNIIDSVINNPLLQARTRAEAIELIERNVVDSNKDQPVNTDKLDVLNYEGQGYLPQQDSMSDTFEVIHNIVNNIIRVLDYFSSREKGRVVKNIYISCDGIQLNYLYKLLEKQTGVKVNLYDKILKSTSLFNDNANVNLQSQYLLCLGSAIDPVYMEQRKEEEESTGNSSSILLTAAIFGVLVILSGALSLKSFLDYRATVDDKSKMSARIKVLEGEGVVETFNTYNETTDLFNKYVGMYAETRSNNENLDTTIAAIEDQLPKASRVTSLSLTNDSIILNIQTGDDKEVVAQTIASLREIENFDSVKNLGFTEEVDENGLSVISFTVECVYSPYNTLEVITNEVKEFNKQNDK